MPNYGVRIEWTPWGLDPKNPESVDERIQHAMEAADRHKVTGHNNVPLDRNLHRVDEGDNLHITWHVYGIQADVQAMVDRWNGGSDGPGFPAFVANVRVLEWPQEK